ncbi:MAG: BON domain-containing protein [Chloroflexi bacterium]|nr:BON domain-containing protein [Chloroflexota bacterium]
MMQREWGRDYPWRPNDDDRYQADPDDDRDRWGLRSGDRGYYDDRGRWRSANGSFRNTGYETMSRDRGFSGYHDDRERQRGRYGQPGYGRASYPYDSARYDSAWFGGAGYGRPSGAYFEPVSGESRFGESHYGRSGDYGRLGFGREEYRRGQFAGRGPRGYTRSDDRIREDVYDRLTDHPDVDASDIDVQVDNGIVTLSGSIDDRWQRREAEDVVDSVSGVRDIHNNLRINRQGANSVTNRGTFARTATSATASPPGAAAGATSATASPPGATAGATGDVTATTTASAMGSATGSTVRGAVEQGSNRPEIHRRMDVVGSDGDQIGVVKDVRDGDFLIDRPAARDVYAPFGVVDAVIGNRIILTIPADQVDNMNWPNPALIGGSTSYSD